MTVRPTTIPPAFGGWDVSWPIIGRATVFRGAVKGITLTTTNEPHVFDGVNELQRELNISRNTITDLEARLDAAVQLRQRTLREFEDFKVRVRSRMIEEAENRGWCSDFDQILVEFGLEPRGGDFEVTIRFEGTYSRTVRARDEARAEHLVYEELPFTESRTATLNDVDVYIDNVSTDSVDREDD